MRSGMRRGLLVLAFLLGVVLVATLPAAEPTVHVTAVDSVGMTVQDMDRALAFYTGVLPFVKEYDVEVAGRPWEQLEGVFGARARVVGLRLGDERLELTDYLAPELSLIHISEPTRPY